jgi:ring-1,2-phenylacetyl-CoA epoxidase subunit PaaE
MPVVCATYPIIYFKKMADYYTLKVKDIVQETTDTKTFHLKQPLFRKVKYKSGQFVTVKLDIQGNQVMRSYSMSSTPDLDDTLAITVKRVENGLVSNYLNDHIQAGTSLQVMEPKGNFTFAPDRNTARHIVLFGAGSGITPLMSILKAALFFEQKSTVSLVYGNRHEDAVIFKKQLDDLKAKFGDRFNLVYVYSQPARQWNGYKGRIDVALAANVVNLLPKLGENVTEYYLCGPDGMMEAVREGLKKLKVPTSKVHVESFTSSNETAEALEHLGPLQEREVTVILDGESHKITVPPNKSILETGLDAGLDMPFSCQSGVCTACRGKCLSGEVRMSEGDGLSADELKEGYVLTCVGHPMTDGVVVEIG